uniref:basic proline-rich protein-like n=1 Tax=Macaca mulatta TaxID=9544 RepID=UPI0010A247EC|nr:basic proline-rich protein-like [Macaca mulatta]
MTASHMGGGPAVPGATHTPAPAQALIFEKGEQQNLGTDPTVPLTPTDNSPDRHQVSVLATSPCRASALSQDSHGPSSHAALDHPPVSRPVGPFGSPSSWGERCRNRGPISPCFCRGCPLSHRRVGRKGRPASRPGQSCCASSCPTLTFARPGVSEGRARYPPLPQGFFSPRAGLGPRSVTASVGPGNRSFVKAKPATISFSHHLEDPLSVRPSRPQAAEKTWGRGSRKPRPKAPSTAPRGILQATRSCTRGRARASESRWGLRAPIPPRPASAPPASEGFPHAPAFPPTQGLPRPPGRCSPLSIPPRSGAPGKRCDPAPLRSLLPRTLPPSPLVVLGASLKPPTRVLQPTREARAPATRPRPQGPRPPVALPPPLRPPPPLARPPPTTTPA